MKHVKWCTGQCDCTEMNKAKKKKVEEKISKLLALFDICWTFLAGGSILLLPQNCVEVKYLLISHK